MTYREILELYKQGKLDEDKKIEVAADIEKQDAISEYLFEVGAEPEWGTDADTFTDMENDSEKPGEEAFTKEIRRSIRKAFIRMGVIVGAAVLAIVAFCTLLLPDIVSKFYYDPGKIVGGVVDEASETNQMSLDMAVYTELAIPFEWRDHVTVESKGFGNYDIYIPQTTSYNDTWRNTAGKIEKGKLTLYDSNIFLKPTGNIYDWYQATGDLSRSLGDVIEAMDNDSGLKDGENILHGIMESPKVATEALKKLDEDELYIAYFSLNHMMDYKKFAKLIGENDGLTQVWCTVKTNDTQTQDGSFEGNFEEDNLGFFLTASYTEQEWDEEKYPNLLLWKVDCETGDTEVPYTDDEEFMQKHFVSMLRYMQDQEDFCEMMDEDAQHFGDAADFVEENGLTIYGFAARADKETLLEWNEMEEIYSIVTEQRE